MPECSPGLGCLVKKFDAYYGGDKLLWSLTRLAAKKHQRIVTVSPNVSGMGLNPGKHGRLVFHMKEMAISKSVNSRNEFKIAVLYPGSPLDVNISVTFNIIFSAVEVVSNYEVSLYLAKMIDKVEAIINGIEAEVARIKATTT